MIPWIQVYSNLCAHRKTCKLRDALGLKANYEAVGLVVCLWSWAAVNASDGNLTGYNARDIADAVGYKKSPAKLLEAMVQAGFLDQHDNTTTIHDWDVHAKLLMDCIALGKQKNAERQQRYRERKNRKKTSDNNAVAEADNNAQDNATVTIDSNVTNDVTSYVTNNVTDNKNNAPTIPNHTIPYLTRPNISNYTMHANTTVQYMEQQKEAPAPFGGKMFTSFWEAYPCKIGRQAAWEAWKALNPTSETADRIMEALKSWKVSKQWEDDGGRYIPRAAKWLMERNWESPPATDWLHGRGERKLDADEMEAIRRMMSMDEEEENAGTS